MTKSKGKREGERERERKGGGGETDRQRERSPVLQGNVRLRAVMQVFPFFVVILTRDFDTDCYEAKC